MESNGMYSNMGSGMLGLEMSLHHVPPQQNPHSMQPMVTYVPHVDHRQQSQPSLRPKSTKGLLSLSDEDEPVGAAAPDPKTSCPWQRMKWTDNMVRLLITVVYYIGDEVGAENDPTAGNINTNNNNKKKGSGGVLQKKGKWKSVSTAMMERGFYVSPQQCEDKFNDLNKRYKRVNDIIGKGTACKVVENQRLLETMDISPKLKEEVKKLLNSKHLFFREMCAYHNSCGHAGTSGPPEEPNNQQHKCLHSAEEESKVDLQDDEDDDDDDEDSDDDDDVEEEEEEDERARKRARKTESWSSTPMMMGLTAELTNVFEDGTRSVLEKRRWIKARVMQLEEQRVEYKSEALELEKQRLKWEKFRCRKEREMEKEKIMNQRKKLENERMVLLLHQKEMDLLDVHQYRTSDPSSVTLG